MRGLNHLSTWYDGHDIRKALVAGIQPRTKLQVGKGSVLLVQAKWGMNYEVDMDDRLCLSVV
jgi:hypothetical protein